MLSHDHLGELFIAKRNDLEKCSGNFLCNDTVDKMSYYDFAIFLNWSKHMWQVAELVKIQRQKLYQRADNLKSRK